MYFTCILLNFCDYETTSKAALRYSSYDQIDKVVVVDNCSPTGDYEYLKEISSNKIDVLKADKNGGYGYGNNIGLDYSKNVLNATHAIICNPDVCFSNDCVSKLRSEYKIHPECVSVVPVTYFKDHICASKLPTAWQLAFESISLCNKVFGRKTQYSKQDYQDKDNFYPEVVVGAMTSYNLKKLGNIRYDERFFLYCEELVMGYILKSNKLKTKLCFSASYTHELSHSIDKEYDSLLKRRELSRNSKILFLRYYLHVTGVKMIICRAILRIANLEASIIDAIVWLRKMHIK